MLLRSCFYFAHFVVLNAVFVGVSVLLDLDRIGSVSNSDCMPLTFCFGIIAAAAATTTTATAVDAVAAADTTIA